LGPDLPSLRVFIALPPTRGCQPAGTGILTIPGAAPSPETGRW
jgi:hypothetical protein